MKINVAVFDKDDNYTEKLSKGFQNLLNKEASIRVFSDEEIFLSEIKKQHFDIAILDREYITVKEGIPEWVVTAVFVLDNSIEEVDNVPAVGKYQELEKMHKRLLGILADKSVGIKMRRSGVNANTILFTSVQGGCGTSSLAAAYAVSQSRIRKNVFYLNLERFGSANTFFSGEGKGSFSDIIYALKSKTSNLPMKIQSATKRDLSGVEFIDSCRNAYDMLELKDSEVMELLESINASKEYDLIVVDYSGPLTPRQLALMNKSADSIIYVNDGSVIGNDKFIRCCEAIRIIEDTEGMKILNKMSLVYNRYSSKTSEQLKTLPITLIGGIHRIEGISGRILVEELSKEEVVQKIG